MLAKHLFGPLRLVAVLLLGLGARAESVSLTPKLAKEKGESVVEIWDGDRCALKTSPGGILRVFVSGKETAATLEGSQAGAGRVELRGQTAEGLGVTDIFETIGPALVRRTTRFTAKADLSFFAALEYDAQLPGEFYSFLGRETKPVCLNQENSGQWAGGPAVTWPKRTDGIADASQLFPVATVLGNGTVYGVFGDSPAFTHNRGCQVIDPQRRRIALQNGEERAATKLGIDGREVPFDHKQSLKAGETLTWTTHIFRSPARSHYEAQLATHLALANAKNWNGSAVEAINRNIGYLLCRENLLHWGTNSASIIISGNSYGWKQWSSDAFYTALGLREPALSQNAYDGLFLGRLTYEDNAQLYLIWSALLKKGGGKVNEGLARQAFEFIRKQEKDGAFIPPRMQPNYADGKPNLGWKTYMDLFFYDDGDCPSSNQGFHCAALVAAKELGYGVTEEDIARAAKVYAGMFNPAGGYFATSRQLQHILSQDALMGEALGYALFGRKFLPDELVARHIATVEKGKTPHGLRVFCQPDGSLLPVAEYGRKDAPNPNISEGRQGAYVSGGSWFFCDVLTYLAGTIHGVDTEGMQQWRIERELRDQPSFKEYLHTLTGAPEGNLLYSWNSAYWSLRRECRARMGLAEADEMLGRVDAKLGMAKAEGRLVLAPGSPK